MRSCHLGSLKKLPHLLGDPVEVHGDGWRRELTHSLCPQVQDITGNIFGKIIVCVVAAGGVSRRYPSLVFEKHGVTKDVSTSG